MSPLIWWDQRNLACFHHEHGRDATWDEFKTLFHEHYTRTQTWSERPRGPEANK